MFQDAFSKLEPHESAAALQEINPLLQDVSFDPASATLLACDLSFYPEYRFIDVADYKSTPTPRRYLVYKPGHIVVLNWTNDPIYALNKAAPVMLTTDTVVDYVRFYFNYVRGRHGKFTIAESVNDIPWHEDPPPAARKAVGRMIQPVQMIGVDKDGTFNLFVCLMFRDSLFRATVRVHPDGTVVLQDEELLVEDMPVRDDTFGQ
jgi:hypothetical protein